MAKIFHRDSQFSSDNSSTNRYTTKPSSEFYSLFSETEVLEIIHALEVRREMPLKYSYKGRGAKIWDDFYLKYVVPRWYRTSNVEIELLQKKFAYINSHYQGFNLINVVDVGAGNSYPVKKFIAKLHKLHKINQYIALDVSDELLKVSKSNFQKWFPSIEFVSQAIDIENSCIDQALWQNSSDDHQENIANVFLHLGVTIGNHHNRIKVFKNFKDSMGKNDLLVFTNEIGSNSRWDGKPRGGCDYHAGKIFEWIKSNIGIRYEDCELIRKYDVATDSVVANVKIRQNYTINFQYQGIDKQVNLFESDEITIWRHHKHEIPELVQEIEQAGLKLVHYTTNKYLTHIMVICQVVSTKMQK